MERREDPLDADPRSLVRAPRDGIPEHALQLRLAWTPAWWLRLGVLGRLESGVPFTPRVDGDVNGDGALDDPAFVFAPPDAADTALGAAMSGLLEDAPGRIRQCLLRQAGRVAARNSCRTGWSSGLDLRIDLQPLHPPRQRRFELSLTTQNLLGVVDRLAHGADGVHGWGEARIPDATLLRVRSFDPDTRAFRYEVNPRFGMHDAARLPAPFQVTLEGRVTVGRDPAYQPLQRLVNGTAATGRSPQVLRDALGRRIPNLPGQVLAVDSAAHLELSTQQREILVSRGEALGAALAPLADSLAQVVGEIETGRRRSTRETAHAVDALQRRIGDALDQELRALRDEVLTPAQWQRLPEPIRNPSKVYIPPRCITTDRTQAAPEADCGAP